MGGIPLTTVVIHHDHTQLPPASDELVPVQIYGLSGLGRGDISVIGNPVIDPVKRLGVQLSPVVMDFMTISLAVTAADTFVKRKNAADGWAREIKLQIPLCEPEPWLALQNKLEKALQFLSGDLWSLELKGSGYKPPTPYHHNDRFHLVKLRQLDSVCLFSGGLDSTIGAIDIILQGKQPFLVSHAYKGDKSRQDAIAAQLNKRYSRFAVNAYPQSANGKTDTTMRTRSISFIAFAAVGCNAVSKANQIETVDLFIPENGFISLNAPLTSSRIGSLSTRTTHPHFLEAIREIFERVGIRANIINPYRFLTKGEMIQSCLDQNVLQTVLADTVSCSHWKRINQQCGCCVPCLIRRAAIAKGDLQEPMLYRFQDLKTILRDDERRDDLFALMAAIDQSKKRAIGPWTMDSGPLPAHHIDEFKGVFVRGLREVESFLQGENLL
jgi:hypothetical protein